MTTGPSGRILVPIGESVTLRKTVAYAVREARECAEAGEAATVHFVYPITGRVADPEEFDEPESLLDRVEVWAREDLGDEDGSAEVRIETAVQASDVYLFSPIDYARTLIDYAAENDLDRVIVDPEYTPAGSAPMVQPLEYELSRSDLTIEEAPVERKTRRARLVRGSDLAQFATVFGASYLFYLVIGGFAGTFDYVTGAFSAAVTAALLSQISLSEAPDSRTPLRALRALVYAPYLLWEIAKANVTIAYVVLHPRLPIDPGMVEFKAAVWDDVPVTTLANSITLTPGTLTVDVRKRRFYVHTLTTSAREDLLDGGLERAVRFVFYGRQATNIESPAERRADEEVTEE
ncbi:monovalent cation/H+ antiporter subunit E [Halostella pelagica]|uniref:monovalent cation/H+ antiporter subunit E n=1 Tax=Halostella pelagica TaxID=2583824 RepID=UPI0010807BC2|nr:monovalent cation/H+ antiporter subunit E [Halostella pelagica]